MRCPRCEANTPDAAKFCIECGTPLTAENSAPPSAPPSSPLMSEPDGHLHPVSPEQVSEPVPYVLLPHTTGCGVEHDRELSPRMHRLTWLHVKDSDQEGPVESPSSMLMLLVIYATTT
jgi:Double zinc ribbon